MPNPALFVPIQPGSGAPLQKPAPRAQQRQAGAKLRAPCGLRGGCCGLAAELPCGPCPSEDPAFFMSPLWPCAEDQKHVFPVTAMVVYLRRTGCPCPERAAGVNRMPP